MLQSVSKFGILTRELYVSLAEANPKDVFSLKMGVSHPYHLWVWEINVSWFSDLPNIYTKFHKNRSSRFEGVCRKHCMFLYYKCEILWRFIDVWMSVTLSHKKYLADLNKTYPQCRLYHNNTYVTIYSFLACCWQKLVNSKTINI